MDRLLSQESCLPNKQSSLLQRVLSLDPSNPKLAQILSLDMFIVGIDTVNFTFFIYLYYTLIYILMMRAVNLIFCYSV